MLSKKIIQKILNRDFRFKSDKDFDDHIEKEGLLEFAKTFIK